MSGARRSYCAPEATSSQDSLNGLQVKVELRNGHQVPCKLSAASVPYLAQCVNCGFYALEWATLRCGHSLCEGCFVECEEYFCAFDQVTTRKFEAKSGRCQYTVYKDVLIECPCCSRSRDLYTIATHIENCHSKFSVRNSSTTPNSAPRNERKFCDSKDHYDKSLHSLGGRGLESLRPEAAEPPQSASNTKMFTEDDYLDSPQEDPGNTLGRKTLRSLCSEPHLKQSDRKEHEKISQIRDRECENYKIAVPEKDFAPHYNGLYVTEHCDEGAAKLRVKEEEDDRSEDEILDDEIRGLKAKIQMLEERLEEIEKPLRKIIQRLSKNQ
ncbi:uncharacterized protein [Dermacentor andersoni]|uniref:uncharacterized protein isoform X2 n=1 Tax=Dermacentor andersoni TaxID=34620 RepID=UPI0024160D66|nr:uncharacterized protein LOC126544582 isoform X2 [Dermacentor andersoni]